MGLPVVYRPVDQAPASAELALETDHGTFTLELRGAHPEICVGPENSAQRLPQAEVGKTASQTVLITITGYIDLVISNIETADDSDGVFRIDASAISFPIQVGRQESLRLPVVYRPEAADTSITMLVVNTDVGVLSDTMFVQGKGISVFQD